MENQSCKQKKQPTDRPTNQNQGFYCLIVWITNPFDSLVHLSVFALKKVWDCHRRFVRHWNSVAILQMWKTCKKHPLQLSWKYLVSLTYTTDFPRPYLTNVSQKIKMVINSLASIQGKNYMPSKNKIRIVPKLVWCKLYHNSFWTQCLDMGFCCLLVFIFFSPSMKKCLNYFFCTKPRLLWKIQVTKPALPEFRIKFQRRRKQFCQFHFQRPFSYGIGLSKYIYPIRTCTLRTSQSLLIIIFSYKIKTTKS